MAVRGSRARGRNVLVLLGAALTVAALGSLACAEEQDLVFSAKVDKTTVDLGTPVTLAITLSGDLSGVQLPAFEFPEGLMVAARSQSTSFSVRAGAAERATSLQYLLIPQRAGTFQLGPFTIEHHHKELKTEPIEITVKKSALPPSQLQSKGERFTL